MFKLFTHLHVLYLRVRFHLVSSSFIMKQCDYFWSGFNTQQDQKNNDRVQLAVWEIEAAKSKEQAKRNLIDL